MIFVVNKCFSTNNEIIEVYIDNFKIGLDCIQHINNYLFLIEINSSFAQKISNEDIVSYIIMNNENQKIYKSGVIYKLNDFFNSDIISSDTKKHLKRFLCINHILKKI